MFGYPFRPSASGAPRLRPTIRASETFAQPPTGPLASPNESVLAPAGGKENIAVHPLVRPSSPPPPTTPRLRPDPGPAPPPPQQVPPPNCYAATDPGIFWLNNRPYWVHRRLGKGGFGEVHEVEMLLPRGLEVDWDEKGDLLFDEHGCLALKQSDDSVTQESRPLARTHADTDSPSPSEAPQAEVSLSLLSMSMTTSDSMWFSLARREQTLNGDRLSGGGLGLSSEDEDAQAVDGSSTKRTSVYEHFPAGSGNFVQRSGVFFAVKLQRARNEKELDFLVKEVENMCLLSGDASTVQLRDHAVDRKSLHLVILMELGACDLHAFLNQVKYCLDVPSIAQVWSILVHRIESLHKFDVIHRDIKPQNFILVPTDGYRGARILATTSTPREDFVFRLVKCDEEGPTRKQSGDVELVIKDPTTNKEEVVQLSIKITDFGIARSLDGADPDASHISLSLPGPNGTVAFMAPENVRQTVSRCRKVSKRVDIWALGVMLYQMLHAGKTPFWDYLVNGGPPEALLAVASETINREAMKFDTSHIWRAERARLLWGHDPSDSETHHPHPTSEDELPTMTAEMVRALVVSWVGAELLVRLCKRCLVFDVDDRIDGTDLRDMVDGAMESGCGLRNFNLSQSELLQAAFNIDANGMVQTVDSEIARIGDRVGASLFPGIWMPSLSAVQGGVSGSSSSSQSPKVNDKHDPEARPSALPPACGSESGDSFDHRPRRRSFLEILALIIVSLIVGAGLCVTIGVAVRSPWSGMGGGEDIGPSSNDEEEAPRPAPFLGGGGAGGGAAGGGVAGGGVAGGGAAGDGVAGGSVAGGHVAGGSGSGGGAVGGSAGGGGAATVGGAAVSGGISVGGGTEEGGVAGGSVAGDRVAGGSGSGGGAVGGSAGGGGAATVGGAVGGSAGGGGTEEGGGENFAQASQESSVGMVGSASHPKQLSSVTLNEEQRNYEERFASLKKFVLGEVAGRRIPRFFHARDKSWDYTVFQNADPAQKLVLALELPMIPTIERLRADREVVLAAVAENWVALASASPELQADAEVVRRAVGHSRLALEYAYPERMRFYRLLELAAAAAMAGHPETADQFLQVFLATPMTEFLATMNKKLQGDEIWKIMDAPPPAREIIAKAEEQLDLETAMRILLGCEPRGREELPERFERLLRGRPRSQKDRAADTAKALIAHFAFAKKQGWRAEGGLAGEAKREPPSS